MSKLKLSGLPDNKPVKVTLELPAHVHRDLLDYAEILGHETGQTIADATLLIAPMIQRFIATDRAFAKARHTKRRAAENPSEQP